MHLLLWNINDLILGLYTLFRFIECSLFFTSISIMSAIIFISHSSFLEKTYLLKVIAKSKAKKEMACSNEVMNGVMKFITEHNTIWHLVTYGNQVLWGKVMASFVLNHLPINIYVLTQIVLSAGSIDSAELLVLIIVLTVQLTAFSLIMGPMSTMCVRLHAPQDTIVALQQHLMGRDCILLKCKLDDLKERLSSGPKITVTIGRTRQVTFETMMEVLGLYFAYLMKIFSQQLENTS